MLKVWSDSRVRYIHVVCALLAKNLRNTTSAQFDWFTCVTNGLCGSVAAICETRVSFSFVARDVRINDIKRITYTSA